MTKTEAIILSVFMITVVMHLSRHDEQIKELKANQIISKEKTK